MSSEALNFPLQTTFKPSKALDQSLLKPYQHWVGMLLAFRINTALSLYIKCWMNWDVAILAQPNDLLMHETCFPFCIAALGTFHRPLFWRLTLPVLVRSSYSPNCGPCLAILPLSDYWPSPCPSCIFLSALPLASHLQIIESVHFKHAQILSQCAPVPTFARSKRNVQDWTELWWMPARPALLG